MRNEEGDAGKAAAVELYITARYFALTNKHLPGTPLALRDASDAVQRLLGRMDQLVKDAGTAETADEVRARDPTNPWTFINSEALKNLDAWVLELFGEGAVPQGSTGGYRVSSDFLGRDLEEDLGITPQGIVDWGVHDLPDEKRGGRRTAIDLVEKYGEAANALQAAHWLAERLGVEAEFEEKLNARRADAADDMFAEFGPGDEQPEGEPPGSDTPEDEEPAEDAMPKSPLPYFQGMSYRNAARREMVVKQLLGAGEFSVWFGPPKVGKSFLMTDAALAVASGADRWFGHRVKRSGFVLYLVLEGSGGFGSRLDAWRAKHGKDVPDNFVWTSVRLTFVAEQTKAAAVKDVQKIIALVKFIETQGRACCMIVVDTCARAMTGADENSSQDMGKLIDACKILQDLPSRPHVAVVHHENAGGTKPRGSTALMGAGDTFIRVQKLEKGRTWTVEWAKDDADGLKHGFGLETVLLGVDDDGDVLESCAVVEAPVPVEEPKESRRRRAERTKKDAEKVRQPRGKMQRIVLMALRQAVFDTPDAAPAGLDTPIGASVVTRETWWRAASEDMPQDDAKQRKDTFTKAVEGLIDGGFVEHHKRKFYWPVE